MALILVGHFCVLRKRAVFRRRAIQVHVILIHTVGIIVITKQVDLLIAIIKSEPCIILSVSSNIPASIYRTVCAEGLVLFQTDIDDPGITCSFIFCRWVGDKFDRLDLNRLKLFKVIA